MKLQHTFTINHTSLIDNQTYTGTFTCKKMSVQDSARLGVRITQLNGGMHYDDDTPGYGVDAQTNAVNHMIATLELTLVSKPDWFNVDELIDMELLSLVFQEVRSFENKFRRSGSKSGDASPQNSAAGSSAADKAPNGPRALGTVVDYEVQASLEP